MRFAILPSYSETIDGGGLRLTFLQEVNNRGETVLCRTENFADCHKGFSNLLRSPKLLGLLNDLAEEPMLLFKEKINYKLSGSGEKAPPQTPLKSGDPKRCEPGS
jgi:hypothetical protein